MSDYRQQQEQEEEQYWLEVQSRQNPEQTEIIQKFIQFTEPICQSQTLPPL